MQSENKIEPGMGCRTLSDAQRPPPEAGLPGDAPRGPLKPARKPAPYPLPWKVDIRLTDELRAALRKRALDEGITDSACARRILLRALGLESDLDNRTGFDVKSEELLYTSKMLANLRSLVLDARELQDGQARGVIMAMEAQHARLVNLIGRMDR